MKIVNILGTDYTLEIRKRIDDKKLEHCDGYCDFSIKKLICVDIDDLAKDNIMIQGDTRHCQDRVIRHEIVHAFLYESGLSYDSSWADNEECVDWIAIQFYKMYKAFESLNQ